MAPTTRSAAKAELLGMPKGYQPRGMRKYRNGMRKHRNGMLNVKKSYLPDVTLRNATESPLLLLPAELRNMIWNYALMAGEIVTIREKWYTDAPSGDRIYALGSPNVRTLQVCRQIYAETASLPFSINKFAFPQPRVGQAYLKSLCSGQRNAIQTIELSCMFNYPNLIKQLPAVKSVYMDHPWDDGTCPCDPKHERIMELFREKKSKSTSRMVIVLHSYRFTAQNERSPYYGVQVQVDNS